LWWPASAKNDAHPPKNAKHVAKRSSILSNEPSGEIGQTIYDNFNQKFSGEFGGEVRNGERH
jgi:hypothetical protein